MPNIQNFHCYWRITNYPDMNSNLWWVPDANFHINNKQWYWWKCISQSATEFIVMVDSISLRHYSLMGSLQRMGSGIPLSFTVFFLTDKIIWEIKLEALLLLPKYLYMSKFRRHDILTIQMDYIYSYVIEYYRINWTLETFQVGVWFDFRHSLSEKLLQISIWYHNTVF